MKTVFFGLGSVALILFLYWQWHLPRAAHPHLERVSLTGPTLRIWEPGMKLPEKAAHPVIPPRVPRHPGPPSPSVSGPPPPPAGPAIRAVAVQAKPPPPVPAPARPVCRLIGWFPDMRMGRSYAGHWHFRNFRLERHVRILHLYRVYLVARTPAARNRVLAHLEASHLHGFYLMNNPSDPDGYSVGVYDALSGAFQRREQLLRRGLHPHLEIRTHRQLQVWITVTTRKTPTSSWHEWQNTPLHVGKCPRQVHPDSRPPV